MPVYAYLHYGPWRLVQVSAIPRREEQGVSGFL